jgi:hypothetical protein
MRIPGPFYILVRLGRAATLGGQECPMPLGIDPPHPGGMAENRREFRGAQVPKGRLNEPHVLCQLLFPLRLQHQRTPAADPAAAT